MRAFHAPDGRHVGWVGNDVIDLGCAENPRPHPRFTARVLSPREQAALAERCPAGGVWSYFAAKEAAYKLFVKLAGRSVPFEHQRFEVDATLSRVDGPHGSCRVRVDVQEERAHAIAWLAEAPPLSAVATVRDPGDESGAARRLAVLLAARSFKLSPALLSVRRVVVASAWDGAEPPQLLLAGKLTSIDVSLSHHGRFVAAALTSVGLEARS